MNDVIPSSACALGWSKGACALSRGQAPPLASKKRLCGSPCGWVSCGGGCIGFIRIGAGGDGGGLGACR